MDHLLLQGDELGEVQLYALGHYGTLLSERASRRRELELLEGAIRTARDHARNLGVSELAIEFATTNIR
jgi:hypothetical protein